MTNVIYIDDNINYYSNHLDKILVSDCQKDTVRYGIIYDYDKFNRAFERLLSKYKLKNNLIKENLTVITPPNFSPLNKMIYQKIFDNFNYHKVKFYSEVELYKLNRYKIFLNINKNYFNISYIKNGKTISNTFLLELDYLIHCLDKFKNKDIYLIGNNFKNIIDYLEYNTFNYYYFERTDSPIMLFLENNENMT